MRSARSDCGKRFRRSRRPRLLTDVLENVAIAFKNASGRPQSSELGVPSENGPDRTLRLTHRPEFAFTEFRGVAPLVVAGEIDVLPAKRGKMLSERRVWGMPVFA